MIPVCLRMVLVLGLVFVAAGCGGKKAEPVALPVGITNALPGFAECKDKLESEQRRCNVKVHKKRIDYLANPLAQGLLETKQSSGSASEEKCGTLACADLEQFIARLGRMKGRHGQCKDEIKDDVLFFIEKENRHFSDTYVAPESSVGWQARVELSRAIFTCNFSREDVKEAMASEEGFSEFNPGTSSIKVKGGKNYCTLSASWGFWDKTEGRGRKYESVVSWGRDDPPGFDAVFSNAIDEKYSTTNFRNIWAYSGGSPYWNVSIPISGFHPGDEKYFSILPNAMNYSWLEATRRLVDFYIFISLRDYKSRGGCK
ncbi:hypothetical protein OS176_02490 [Xanthomonadaceae bacterium XH05]|nr:hypothetical protein [Xanthomonadaceae bacterium XH05]